MRLKGFGLDFLNTSIAIGSSSEGWQAVIGRFFGLMAEPRDDTQRSPKSGAKLRFKRIIGSIHGNLRIQLDPNNCSIRTDVSVDFVVFFFDLFRKAQAAPTLYPFLLSVGHEFFCAMTLLY